MIKIGLFCNDKNQKKEIKNLLKQYFVSLRMESEITSIRTKLAALKNMTAGYIDYNIVILCEENRLTYIKKNIVNHFKNYSNITVGWIAMPITQDKIEEIIFNEDYHNCPRGMYKFITNKTIRAIPYGDIIFFRWNGSKTVIHLKDYETEEQNLSISKIKEKLPDSYFAECIKGYIINLYSIKKIDKANHELVMHSGHRIPISDRKYSTLVRLYIEDMFGI